MCDQSTLDLVGKKVKEFISKEVPFTSVDVANEIKEEGTWVKNREVARFLRNYDFSSTNYQTSNISVSNGRTARLYHPDFIDAETYDNTDQRALTPNEVGINVKSPAPATIADEKKVSSIGKIRIPAKLAQKVDLYPGQDVDPDKIDADSVLDKQVSRKLKVNADGRINICGPLKNGYKKVYVGVANGALCLRGV